MNKPKDNEGSNREYVETMIKLTHDSAGLKLVEAIAKGMMVIFDNEEEFITQVQSMCGQFGQHGTNAFIRWENNVRTLYHEERKQ